ncbi:MAG: hypothetical protein R3313_02620 [Candidatus Saccharimonadales bacterium]|nr:hypothetical protein [Candidatus Saccharimonadales bacterium]
MRKQRGFGIIEIILILCLIGAVALTWWKMNNPPDDGADAPVATSESVELPENKPDDQPAETAESEVEENDAPTTAEPQSFNGFSLLLPSGWTLLTDSGTAGVDGGREITFSKDTQIVRLVIGNQLGSGAAADLIWFYEFDSTGRQASLTDSPEDICIDRFSGFCSGGNEKLEIFVKLSDSAPAVPANGHGHIFFINDSAGEEPSPAQLDEYRSIINSLEIEL